jgi:hypothetical protein
MTRNKRLTATPPLDPDDPAAYVRLEQVTDELYAQHTTDTEGAAIARREYEERRGRVHQEDDLWEPWSAAFVEWYVVERVAANGLPPAAHTYRAMLAAGQPDEAAIVRALITSQRSLFEVRALKHGIDLLDLLGGAELHVDEQRTLHGVQVGDVAELRIVGVPGRAGEGGVVRFGRTFIYHPAVARGAIVERARAMLGAGASRRDVIDQIAQLRVQVTRYRHMAPARVYELGSRILG